MAGAAVDTAATQMVRRSAAAFHTTELTYVPPFVNKDTVYFPALLESRTKKPPSLFWENNKDVYISNVSNQI